MLDPGEQEVFENEPEPPVPDNGVDARVQDRGRRARALAFVRNLFQSRQNGKHFDPMVTGWCLLALHEFDGGLLDLVCCGQDFANFFHSDKERSA